MDKIKANKYYLWIIICSIITFILGIADLVLDILHTKGDAIGMGFLVVAIVMSIPAIAWLVLGIILLVKDNNNIIDAKLKLPMLIIIVVSIAAFVPLWIEAFIDGNGIPMFKRALFRQIIWMSIWIIYLLTNVGICVIACLNKYKYLNKK